MKASNTLAVAVALLAVTAGADAALINRGGGMIYDTTRDITWLADMNYAYTSGYAKANFRIEAASNDLFGRMDWVAAVAWADSLVYGGYDDWRLPTVDAGDATCETSGPGLGYNCTGGELGGLFITDLGNRGGQSVLNQVGDTAEQTANLALFSNVKAAAYWSGTTHPRAQQRAFFFDASFGTQHAFDKDGLVTFAVAVRDGNVATAVPEPQSFALALGALAGAGLARRRTQRVMSRQLSLPLNRG